MKRCPFCAEEIQDAAIICRYCQRDLPPSEQTAPSQEEGGWSNPALAGLALTDDSPSAKDAAAEQRAGEDKQRDRRWVLGALLAVGTLLFLIVVLPKLDDARAQREWEALHGGRSSPETVRPSPGPAIITMSKYLALREGMSYEEAVRVLGRHGEEMSRSDLGGITTVMYQWNAGRGIGNMNAMFQNDKLITKAQMGLEP